MRGIELSEGYYRDFGEPMLRERFGALRERLAVGICGPGSENFGFDDAVSRDHDFDPGFFIWLNKEDYKEFEFRLSRAYDALPEEYMGVKLLGKSAYETSRHGVRETGAFFRSLTGFPAAPQTNLQWLSAPQHRLANAVNGRIFYDGTGDVTAVRAALRAMPEDVRRKKLAKHIVFAAQAGQYNYTRALAHGQRGAAVLALAAFAEHTCKAAFLLNRQYCPFYKWMFRAGRDLPKLAQAVAAAETLLTDPLNGRTAEEIERIAGMLAGELKEQQLSDYPARFLEPHAYEIMAGIEDPALRNMHVME